MRAIGALLVMWLVASGAIAATDAPAVRIDLDPPTALGSDGGGLVFLSGRALANRAGGNGLDLVLALDTSDSSDEAAYEAPAERGSPSALSRLLAWLGVSRSAPAAPTIFAEELRAARAVLADLDPRSSRVAIVLLAGESQGATRTPVTALKLTSDFDRARALLDWFEADGPGGQAQWSAGLRRSLALLVGVDGESTSSSAPELRRRALLVLSDARLAPGERSGSDLEAVLDEAWRADVRIDVLVFGEEAARGAPLLRQLAQRTNGRTLGVTRAVDVQDAASAFDHARVAGLEVWNETLAEPARALQRRADGSFGSLLRLAKGENRIIVLARGWNGIESRREIRVDRESVAASSDISALEPVSLALRGRLLRTLHEHQLAASIAARERDLRVASEGAKSEESAPAAAAPAD